MMEEAVMKKCIHEENCSVTTLCGLYSHFQSSSSSSLFVHLFMFSAAVEAWLLHGLKRRAVGLFKTSTTTALLQKIAKSCPSAAEVKRMIDDTDQPSSLLSFSR